MIKDPNLFDSIGFVIKATKDNIFQGCYLGENDVFVSKIKSAKIYHDEIYATSELKKLYKRNNNYEAYDKDKLMIVQVKVTEVS